MTSDNTFVEKSKALHSMTIFKIAFISIDASLIYPSQVNIKPWLFLKFNNRKSDYNLLTTEFLLEIHIKKKIIKMK